MLRAAREWQAAPEHNKFELLVHTGMRLRYAQQLALRGQDWAQEISAATDYLAACSERDASEEAQREASERRILVGKQRLFAAAAGRMSAERRNDAAMRIALAGEIDPDSIKRGVVADPVRYAQLARAAHDSRLLRVAAQLPGAVTCVAFSRDDRLLATGSHDGNARVFDCQTGDELVAFGSHAGWINSIAFSCDGRRLLTGGRDKTVRIWDFSTGTELYRIERILDEVRCVAVNREQFAAGCSDGAISFWDAGTYAARSALNGHAGPVLGLAFNGEGTRLVSGGEDGTVQVWNLADRKSVWKVKLHDEAVNAVVFSPDGSSVASASYDHTARLTDANTGEEIRVLVGHSEPLRSVAFSPDGTRLATSSGDATARIWRVETGREVLRLAGHTGWVHSVAISHDGRQIATGGFDKTVRFWDSNVTKEIVQISGANGDLGSIGVGPEGRRIAVGGKGPIRILRRRIRDRKNFASQTIAPAPASSLSALMVWPFWRQPKMALRTSGRPTTARKSCGLKVTAQRFSPPRSTLAVRRLRRLARTGWGECGTPRPARQSATLRLTMTSCSTWRLVATASCLRQEAGPELCEFSRPAPRPRF